MIGDRAEICSECGEPFRVGCVREGFRPRCSACKEKEPHRVERNVLEIRRLLGETLDEKQVEAFMNTPHALLGNRTPIQRLADGEYWLVRALALAEQQRGTGTSALVVDVAPQVPQLPPLGPIIPRTIAMEFHAGVYQHYKGGQYVALQLVTHHESGEKFVVYVSCGHATVRIREWASPGKDSWTDLVDDGQGGQVPRFRYVGAAE